MIKREKGFTLVELLIVIVIIGLLAGVLVSIINPEKQQNRAKDAGVQATISKVALSTEGFISAYGEVPEGDEFLDSLNNATVAPEAAFTCAAGDYDCTFQVVGNSLPLGECDTNGYMNTSADSTNCYFYYDGNADGDDDPTTPVFAIYGASHGITDTTFVYDSSVGEIVQQ